MNSTIENIKATINGTKAKTIVWAIITTAVLCLVVWGVLKLTGITDKLKEKKNENKLNETINKDIDMNNVTLTTSEATGLCSKLYTAMKGWGTDEEAIYEVFSKVSSASDVLLLIKTFGIKDGKTLIEWITSELNSSERSKLNQILTTNNVNYTF